MPNEILMLIYVSVRLVEASILSFWKFEHFYVTVGCSALAEQTFSPRDKYMSEPVCICIC